MGASALPRISMAVRIALATTLFGLVLIVVGLAVGYWSLSRQLDARAVAEMNGRRELVEHLLTEANSIQSLQSSRHPFTDVLICHDGPYLALEDARTGTQIASYSGPAAEAASVAGGVASTARTPHAPVGRGTRVESMQATVQLSDGTPVRYYLSIDRHEDVKDAGALEQPVGDEAIPALPHSSLVVAANPGAKSPA